MDPVLVVGGGISGMAAARELSAAGVPVQVRDRGRSLGGRMASRTTEGRPVDTGASYFTVSDPAFDAVVEDWRQRGLARPWTSTLAVLGNPDKTETSGPVRWAAPRGLRSLVEDLATGLDVNSDHPVERVEPGRAVGGRAYAAVVLAMPDPQARRLLAEPARGDDPPATPRQARSAYAAALAALDDPYEPVLALTAIWPERTWREFDGAFVNGDHTLGWIADDGRRRGDDAPVLVAHSTTDFARPHLEDPDAAADSMVAALRRQLDIAGDPAYTHVHRWSFARPAGQRDAPFHLDDDLVGACGDGWHGKPRVEGAYLSGRALGRTLADRLS